MTDAASFEQVDTPTLLLDLDVIERNIAEMASVSRRGRRAAAAAHEARKSPEIAAMQITSPPAPAV